jgi:hypothetical protein
MSQTLEELLVAVLQAAGRQPQDLSVDQWYSPRQREVCCQASWTEGKRNYQWNARFSPELGSCRLGEEADRAFVAELRADYPPLSPDPGLQSGGNGAIMTTKPGQKAPETRQK